VNCNQPLVAQFLLDCLTYWVREMHVDGFRFDLASVLSRGTSGEPLAEAPVITSIEFAAALGGTHLIAEAWDAVGFYQVGAFPGFRWADWNGRYRDSVRRFLRGEPGHLGELATRIAGSSDMYAPAYKTPQNSINFVTCHDGFTLNDLVSYDRKHNSANAEHNRDGRDDNHSWNSASASPTSESTPALAARAPSTPVAAEPRCADVRGDEVLHARGNNFFAKTTTSVGSIGRSRRRRERCCASRAR
jgi:glycogen operon protein